MHFVQASIQHAMPSVLIIDKFKELDNICLALIVVIVPDKIVLWNYPQDLALNKGLLFYPALHYRFTCCSSRR